MVKPVESQGSLLTSVNREEVSSGTGLSVNLFITQPISLSHPENGNNASDF